MHGNALTIESTFDEDGMPGTDYRNVASNVYDGHDRLLTSRLLRRRQPAGVYETRYTYDGPGDYVMREVLADYDGDGVPEVTLVESRQVD